jgi:hypothetical protein
LVLSEGCRRGRPVQCEGGKSRRGGPKLFEQAPAVAGELFSEDRERTRHRVEHAPLALQDDFSGQPRDVRALGRELVVEGEDPVGAPARLIEVSQLLAPVGW